MTVKFQSLQFKHLIFTDPSGSKEGWEEAPVIFSLFEKRLAQMTFTKHGGYVCSGNETLIQESLIQYFDLQPSPNGVACAMVELHQRPLLYPLGPAKQLASSPCVKP